MDHILPFSQTYGLLPRTGPILMAFSGGGDSTALLHFLKSQGFAVEAAHFDHHLRPESTQEARQAQAFCQSLDVPFHLGEGFPGGLSGNGEANARALRYAFLEKTADEIGAVRIVTAHQADDNLETILLHMARGCGLRGLAGIRPLRGRLARPMLHTTRQAVEEYLTFHHLPHITDPSNADLSLARNRLRHLVLPQLAALNPRAVEASARLADLLREDEELLEEMARERARAGAPLPPALQYRVKPQKQKNWGKLEEQTLSPGERADTPLWIVTFGAPSPAPSAPPAPLSFYLKDTFCTPFCTLRSRRPGDRIHPPYRQGKTLKKWMIELKIPCGERDITPVLEQNGQVLAAAGIGPQAWALAAPGEPAVFVTFQRKN